MDVYYGYTFATAGWLALQAAPLILSPAMIVTLLAPEVREPSLLEIYFSRSLGITLITLAMLNILLTGSIPLTSRLVDDGSNLYDPVAPYAVPTLTITTLYHAAITFYTYALWTETDIFTYSLGMGGSGLLAAVGVWSILFATSDGRISKKTGADKRTSGWPFTNKEADKKRKKAL